MGQGGSIVGLALLSRTHRTRLRRPHLGAMQELDVARALATYDAWSPDESCPHEQFQLLCFDWRSEVLRLNLMD